MFRQFSLNYCIAFIPGTVFVLSFGMSCMYLAWPDRYKMTRRACSLETCLPKIHFWDLLEYLLPPCRPGLWHIAFQRTEVYLCKCDDISYGALIAPILTLRLPVTFWTWFLTRDQLSHDVCKILNLWQTCTTKTNILYVSEYLFSTF